MKSVDSQVSRATQNAQSIISRIASRNGDPSQKSLAALLDEETVSQVWSAFGLYVGRQLRMGRGVLVKNFGTFTFSAPEVVLEGVTNPLQRDKQPRQPVFLVAKEYVKGKNLRTALATPVTRQIRPYQCQTSGSIQQTIINFAEIAVYAQQNKDASKIGVERVLKAVAEMARNRENVEVDIPGVGTLLIRNDLAAVAFHESLVTQCKGIAKRPLSERRQRGDMKLNQTYLQRLTSSGTETFDEKTKQYLSNTLGIDVDQFGEKESLRPKTAKFPSSSFLKRNQTSGTTTLDRPQTTTGNKSSFQRELNDATYAMERLKYYIRESALNFEDAFLDICNNAFGRTSDRKIKMTRPDFERAIRKIDLPLNDTQIEALFDVIDANQDGKIDRFDWMRALPNQKTHISYIKDVVFKYQLHTDDLLQRMNLHREHAPLDVNSLRDALQHLDESLNSIKALRLAKDILGSQAQITINELVALFDTVEEDDKQYDASWFKDTLHRLRNHLMGSSKFHRLKEAFEFFDEHQEGNLDTANFKTVIMENNVGLSVQDINRLVRYIPKIRGSLINYYDFLKMIEDVNKRADQHDTAKDLADFALKVSKHIKAKRYPIAYFLQMVRTSSSVVLPEQMACYLQNHIFTALSYEQCLQFCREMDLDYDGSISEEDLDAFLKRYSYFDVRRGMRDIANVIVPVVKVQEQGDALTQFEQTVVGAKSIDLLSIGHKKMFKTLVDGMKDVQVKTLNPIAPLTEEKFDRILKDLRLKLQLKGMSYEDFFNLLDAGHNGFITITDFSEQVEKVMSLSQPAKDGFFAFMDRKQIGLIDLNTFLRNIGKSIVQKMPELQEDDFDWELEILFKIRNWCKRENLTVEDAFRTFDKDFDGEISKGDIRLFIVDMLKIEEKLITEARLNRLFKLMDQFKRGRITLMDFRRFLEEGVFYGQNKQIFGNPFGTQSQSAQVQAEIRSSFDWKSNARQQIGLVISRHFPSVKHSYDIISGYRKKLVFQKFKKWIDELNVIAGFDLTEKLLYELFSDLDQHKKGYLTESDWTNAFGHYHWLDQMVREVTEACKLLTDPVAFFKGEHSPVITRDSFFAAVDSLFPKRFQDSDVTSLWNRVQKGGQVTPQAFISMFGDHKSTYIDSTRVTTHPTNEARQQSNVNLIDRIRRFLRNSNKNLPDLFKAYDSESTGKITNIEFRQIMRSLNMGLTLQEIDQLCSVCQSDVNSMFDWKEFAKMLQNRQADFKILDRASIHLARINDHIYNYLIAPKDAFRQFDVDHNGTLSFQQFKELIEALFRLAREEVPPYAIIKDLFEFIDKRRDDLIDLTEWMDAFSVYQNPKAARKRPVTANARKVNAGKKSYLSASEKKQLHINFHGHSATPTLKDFQGIGDDGLMNAGQKFKTFLRKPPRAKDTLQYQDNGTWESSKEFDRIITTIGKNRKYLQDIFKQLSQGGQIPLSEETIKSEMDRMLRSQGIIITEDQWPSLIAWSRRNSRIDYKFLLSVYKDRLAGMDSQPRIDSLKQ